MLSNSCVRFTVGESVTYASEGVLNIPPTDVPCECMLCQRSEYITKNAQQSRQYEGLADEFTSKALIEARAQAVFEMRDTLRKIITAHGSTMVKRWRRKTHRQRHEALSAFRPQLCPQDHPLMRDKLDMWDKSATKDWNRRELSRTRLLLPYLNLERLSAENVRLLSAIFYRTILPPSVFAINDARAFLPSWSAGMIPQALYKGSVRMHGEDFGVWEQLDLSRVHCGLSFGASKAHLVIEAQQRLFWFLIGMTTELLADRLRPLTTTTTPKNIQSALQNLQNELDLQLATTSLKDRSENDTSLSAYVQKVLAMRTPGSLHSLVSRYEITPFIIPEQFPIHRLIAVARERVAEGQDDLQLLQTDPIHLLRRLRHLHKYGSMRMSGASKPKTFDEWSDVTNRGLWLPIDTLTDWTALLQELEHVFEQQNKHKDFIQADRPLPTEYDNALSSLWTMTKTQQMSVQENLWQRATSMPALQMHLQSKTQGFDAETHTVCLEVSVKPSSIQKLREDKMLFIFMMLCHEDEDIFHQNLPQTLALLDQAMALGTRAEVARIDPFLYAIISDLAALEEIIIACETHRPGHAYLNPLECRELKRPIWQALKAATDEEGKCSSSMVDQMTLLDVSTLIQPVNRLIIPHGERNRKWLTHSKRAHALSFDIWQAMEDKVERFCDKNAQHDVLRQNYRDAVRYYKDPNHLAEVEAEHARVQALLDEKDELQALSNLQLSSEPHPTSAKPRAEVKQKPKTRPKDDPDSSTAEADVERAAPINADTSPTILYTVPADELSILDNIFPSDSAHSAARATSDWKSFAALMTKLGFGVEGLGGSAHRFGGEIAIEDDNGGKVKRARSMVIHRPHPDPEMGPELLQAVGKRFRKHFGWCRENFAAE